MYPRTRTSQLKSQQRGFNLIEAAVVLGVIGLVIGGIWVAAAAVRLNFTMQAVSAQVTSSLTAYQRARDGGYDFTGMGLPSDMVTIRAAMALGILPNTCTILPDGSGGFFCSTATRFNYAVAIQTPFGGTAWSRFALIFGVNSPINGTPMSRAECIRIGRVMVNAMRQLNMQVNPLGAAGLWFHNMGGSLHAILTLNGNPTAYSETELDNVCGTSTTIGSISFYEVN